MAQPAPTYDLVLLLDAQAPEEGRTKILEDTRAMIAAGGEVVRDESWGDRALAYPIERKTDAEYHLLQFKASTPELLGELNRTLHITDGLVRFRIVKLAPGTPDPPEMRPSPPASRPAETGAPAQASSAPTPAPAAAPPAEPPAPEPPAPEPPAPEPPAPEPAATAAAPVTEEPAGEPAEQDAGAEAEPA
jgi:small subunit ribosomal protein S6